MGIIGKYGWVLAFLVLAAPNWAWSQLSKQDSLVQEVEQRIPDSTKVVGYLGLFKQFLFSDGERALEMARKGRALADSIGYRMGVGDSYRMEGVYYIVNGATDLALEYYQKAYEVYVSLGNRKAELLIINNFGTVFLELEDFDSAMTYFVQANDISPKTFSDSMLVGTMRHNQAICLDMTGKTEEAYSLFKSNVEFFSPLNANYEKSITYRSLAEAATKLGKYQEALDNLYLGWQLKEEMGDQKALSSLLVQLATAHHGLGNNDSALYLGEKGIVMAKDLGAMNELSDNYKDMAAIYADIGRHDRAYELIKSHLSLADSLRQAATVSKIMNLQSVYGLKQKNSEIEKLQQENALDIARIESNRILIIALISGLVLIFLGLVVMFLYLRARSRLHREVAAKNFALSKANDALNASIKERESLLHMVIHDLKVPLNNSEALVQMLKTEEELPDNVQAALEKMSKSNRRGIEMISDLLTLYEVEAKSQILKQEFNCAKLLESVMADLEGQAAQKSISLRLDCDPQIQLQTNYNMLQRILENLCSNAIKFSKQGTEVVLGLERNVHGLRFYVLDQGPGITAADQKLLFNKFTKLSNRPTAGEHSNGLGLAIVKTLADRLGAKVGLQSKVGEGTKFWLEFPS